MDHILEDARTGQIDECLLPTLLSEHAWWACRAKRYSQLRMLASEPS